MKFLCQLSKQLSSYHTRDRYHFHYHSLSRYNDCLNATSTDEDQTLELGEYFFYRWTKVLK